MGCSSSKLDGLPAVTLCRDRCNSLDETLRRSYAFSDAHAAYLLSLNTVGSALRRFFDQAVEALPDVESEGDESTDMSSPESASPVHSISTTDSDLPPKFDSDCEEDRNEGKVLDLCPELESLNSNHDLFTPINYLKNEPAQSVFYSRNYGSGTVTPPPPPPPSSYPWDFVNFFESYEFPYTTSAKDLKDRESNPAHEDKLIKKVQNKAPTRRNEEKHILSKSEKKKNDSKTNRKTSQRESKGKKVSSDFSQVTEKLQEMFMKASESGNDASKMFDTSRFRCYQKNSVHQASSNILYTVSPSFSAISFPSSKKMAPLAPNSVEDFGSQFSNLSSTLKKLLMWEKKLYQEVKAEEKLRTAHMNNYKQLRKMEQKGTDLRKVEATRSSIQCLSTRMRVSIHVIDNICLMINKLRDEELWPQIKELIHRLSKMWITMLECHSSQSRVISEAKKFDKIRLKETLDISHLELAMELKLELRNWIQALSNLKDAQAQYVKAFNGWLVRCLIQEPQEQRPDHLMEEPPLFSTVNTWSQTLERLATADEFTRAVYALLMHLNRQVEKQRIEMEEQRNVNGGFKDTERRLVMLEKEELKLQRKMKTITNVDSMESLNLKSNLQQIFKSMEKLATNSKQTYEELDLLCT